MSTSGITTGITDPSLNLRIRHAIKVAFIGLPGCGKGTLCRKIAELVGAAASHVECSKVLEKCEFDPNHPLSQTIRDCKSRGELAPDSITIDLIKERIAADVAGNKSILLFDGFPRNLEQANVFADLGNVYVVRVDLAPEICRKRILNDATRAGRLDQTPETIDLRLEGHGKRLKKVFAFLSDRLSKDRFLVVDARLSVETELRSIGRRLPFLSGPPVENRPGRHSTRHAAAVPFMHI